MNSAKVSFKEINKLAIPALLAGIVEPLISLTDTAIAGRLPNNSVDAIAAIGLVGSFLSAMIWIFAQTSNAISSKVSQNVGNKTVNSISPLVSQVIYFNVFIAIILSVLFYCLGSQILALYGAKNNLLETCLRYFNIRVWGFPLTLITLNIFGVFRGFQNTLWAMIISIIGGLTNVILDLVFVFIFDLNIEGIAFASLIAQFIMMVLAVLFLIKNTPFKLFKVFPIHSQFKSTLLMSFDLLIRTISLNVGLFLAYRFITKLSVTGENYFVATHAILIQLWLFSAFLLDGYASAGNAISGKLLGKKDFKNLNHLVKDLVKIMLIVGVLMALVYLIFYQLLGKMLTTSDRVLLIFNATFWIVALMQPVNAISFLFDGIYKGLGETKILRNVFVIALLAGFAPSLYLFDFMSLGIKGVWFSFFIWMIFRAGGLIIHFNKKYVNT